MREFKILYALALVAVIGAALSACAGSRAAGLETLEAQAVPAARSFSGSYLAGRFAQRQQDWSAAQDYMGTVLSYDGTNHEMVQRTFLLALGSGNFDVAKPLAERIIATGEGAELALIFMSCDALSRDDYKAALSYLDRLPATGFGQYTKPMLTAWAMVGEGKKDAALAYLAQHAQPDDPAYRMHAGMIEEMAGSLDSAAVNYRVAMANGLSLHTAVMTANFFERTGRPDITREIYRGLDKVYPYNPFISALGYKDPKRVIAPNITRAADGAALALFDLATLLYEKRAYDSAQIYGSLVQRLAPESPFARLMMGDIAMLHEKFDDAIANYAAIGVETPVYWIARVRMTEVYEVSGRIDDAIAMMTALEKDAGTRTAALVSLGDVYRRHGRFAEAVGAYNRALEGVDKPTAEHWSIIYARGMAEERLNNWASAEKDLMQALAFQPDNAAILNFLAYSWANKGVNLQKALTYAKQAAALKPDDGYIRDSYGWALYRLSQYHEAIEQLEKAVAQVPGDSILLDHLGDAYWQVGRKTEARFQWQHAHDLSKDPSFQKSARDKMANGLATPSQQASAE